jgi:hypothetical protein
MGLERRRQTIEPAHPQLLVLRQCELVSISRSGFHHRPAGETPLDLKLMRLIDAQSLETPWYGSRQMARHLRREGYVVGRKRVRRLMARMGLAPIYQRPRTTVPHPEHRVFPYLLRDLAINRPNQVWCADLTYIPMRRGFLYLVVVTDWATRKVLAWRVSNTMDVEFCLEGLEEALARHGRPEIFMGCDGAGGDVAALVAGDPYLVQGHTARGEVQHHRHLGRARDILLLDHPDLRMALDHCQDRGHRHPHAGGEGKSCSTVGMSPMRAKAAAKFRTSSSVRRLPGGAIITPVAPRSITSAAVSRTRQGSGCWRR